LAQRHGAVIVLIKQAAGKVPVSIRVDFSDLSGRFSQIVGPGEKEDIGPT